MKILFIGGTGNISSAVSRRLLASGHALTLVTRGQRGAAPPGARMVACDLKTPAPLVELLARETFDAVVNWIAFTPADIERDIALFAGRTGQYVFISSASVYQKPPRRVVVTEETPRENPHWEYSRNKIAAEEALLHAVAGKNFPGVIMRPSLTYDTVIPMMFGAWTDFTMVARLRRGAPIVIPGDGHSVWCITHAEDFAAGFCGLLGRSETIGQAYHLTTDEILTWNQIYAALAAAAGVELHAVHLPVDFIVARRPALEGTLVGDKAWSTIFDNSKVRRLIPGFQAKIPFAEGIARTVRWFEADPARCVLHPENDRIHDELIAAYRAAPR